MNFEDPLLKELTGQTKTHVVEMLGLNCVVHKEMQNDLMKFMKKATKAGFKPKIVSSFRNFDRQLTIWNEKALGKRPLLDKGGNSLDFNALSKAEVLHSILRWSSIPGTSRHHWGTDIDIIDQKAVPKDYEVKLIPQEVSDEGMFGPFHQWIDQSIDEDKSNGFFRPYEHDLGGISPERWHLSYWPISKNYMEHLTFDNFQKIIHNVDLELKEEVMKLSKIIYEKFIININPVLPL